MHFRRKWRKHWVALPSSLFQSSARKPLPATLPRETRVIRPEEECCPACGDELSSPGCDVSEQLELISSAFKVIETQRPKLACCRCDHIVQAPVPSKPIAHSIPSSGGSWTGAVSELLELLYDVLRQVCADAR